MWLLTLAKKFYSAYISVLAASLTLNLLCLAVPLFAMNVYDRVVPNNAFETLWALGLGVLLALSLEFLLRVTRYAVLEYAGRSIDAQTSSLLVQNMLLSFGSRDCQEQPFIKQSIFEISPLRELFSAATVSVLADLPFCLLFIAVIFILGGNLGFVALSSAVILALVALGGSLVQQSILQKTVQNELRRKNLGNEILDNLETFQLHSANDWALNRWKKITDLSVKSTYKSQQVIGFITSFNQLILQFSYVCNVIFGVYLISNLELSVGALIAISMLSSRALVPIASIFSGISAISRGRMIVKEISFVFKERNTTKLSEITELIYEQNDYFNKNKINKLELRDISLAYRGQPNQALSGVNLKINQGERVAIIGKVGAGKTSLFRILAGLVPPTHGNYLINDIDKNLLSEIDFLKCIHAVEQKNILFNGNVSDNLLLDFPQISDGKFSEIAALTCLDGVLQTLPKGISTEVGLSGANLSGGQRQIVRLTRSLIRGRDGGIFLWDEPTSSLDRSTEARFIKGMSSALTENSTLILFSHRRPILDLVDRIVVLSEGTIVADGSKSEILQHLSGKQQEI